jgi:hypothetical protein
MRTLAAGAAALALGVACSNTPPPRWEEGGAHLALGQALWRTGDGVVVQVMPDGKVVADGDELFTVDAAGRVYDDNHDPVAIVLPDGNVAGPNDAHLGRIGMANAAPPGGGAAWLSVLPDGRVIHFDPDGERSSDGQWEGCGGPRLRTCTLVTHLYTLERVSRATNGSGVMVGVGVGVGF